MPVLSSSVPVLDSTSPDEVLQLPAQDDLEEAFDRGTRIEATLVVGYDPGRVIEVDEEGILLRVKPVSQVVRLAPTGTMRLLPGDNGFIVSFDGVCEHGTRYRITTREGKATYVVVS